MRVDPRIRAVSRHRTDLTVHTVGYNISKEFATSGWRISSRTYSRQYQRGRHGSIVPLRDGVATRCDSGDVADVVKTTYDRSKGMESESVGEKTHAIACRPELVPADASALQAKRHLNVGGGNYLNVPGPVDRPADSPRWESTLILSAIPYRRNSPPRGRISVRTDSRQYQRDSRQLLDGRPRLPRSRTT